MQINLTLMGWLKLLLLVLILLARTLSALSSEITFFMVMAFLSY
jgi:hypothetical protein